jgi:spore coat protein CotF
MHNDKIPQNLKHGGHEVHDVQEIISGTLNILDQYMIFRQYITCEELLSILNRQYEFIQESYNKIVHAFSNGEAPRERSQYNSQLPINIVYGLKPAQPKKPNRSLANITNQGISGYMLGLIKSQASLKGMAASEITNPIVRRLVADYIPSYIEMSYEIFLYQNKHHYYQIPQYAENDMHQLLNSYAQAVSKPEFPQASS